MSMKGNLNDLHLRGKRNGIWASSFVDSRGRVRFYSSGLRKYLHVLMPVHWSPPLRPPLPLVIVGSWAQLAAVASCFAPPWRKQWVNSLWDKLTKVKDKILTHARLLFADGGWGDILKFAEPVNNFTGENNGGNVNLKKKVEEGKLLPSPWKT